jgi:hypothetical protein
VINFTPGDVTLASRPYQWVLDGRCLGHILPSCYTYLMRQTSRGEDLYGESKSPNNLGSLVAQVTGQIVGLLKKTKAPIPRFGLGTV